MERQDVARRLELTHIRDAADGVEGRAGAVKVQLHGDPPHAAVTASFGFQLPLVRMAMGEDRPDDAEVVMTGDPAFDDVVSTHPGEGHGTWARTVLEPVEVRAALLHFFRSHPFAWIDAAGVHVPAGGGVTHREVEDAVEVARVLIARVTSMGEVAAEPGESLHPSHRPSTLMMLTATFVPGLVMGGAAGAVAYADSHRPAVALTAGAIATALGAILATVYRAINEMWPPDDPPPRW